MLVKVMGGNARNEYIRVFDPRGFEFEISVANLLFILQECTSTRGKGLEGEFVYCWSGTEMTLLPVDSAEYTNDKRIQEFRSIIEKKKLELGPYEKPQYITNCNLCIMGTNVNILTINDIDKLIEIYSFISSNKASLINAATHFNEDCESVIQQLTDQLADTSTRICHLQYRNKLAELNKMEESLDDLRSEELKTADTLNSIELFLK